MSKNYYIKKSTSKKETINTFRNGNSINETVRLAGVTSMKAIRICKFTDWKFKKSTALNELWLYILKIQ
jgi:hypothetical protein